MIIKLYQDSFCGVMVSMLALQLRGSEFEILLRKVSDRFKSEETDFLGFICIY